MAEIILIYRILWLLNKEKINKNKLCAKIWRQKSSDTKLLTSSQSNCLSLIVKRCAGDEVKELQEIGVWFDLSAMRI